MNEKSELQSQHDDAFAIIPVFSIPVKELTSSLDAKNKKQKKTTLYSMTCPKKRSCEGGQNISQEWNSSYVGKKISGTVQFNESKEKEITLEECRIDTENEHFEYEKFGKNEYIPVVFDEDDSAMENLAIEDLQLNYGQHKQNEMSSPKDNSGLALDIRSGEHLIVPSGNEPIKLGSGIIVELLGTGGMAKVYKIWSDTLEMYRAVKLLMPSGSHSNYQRFETESRISANLKHPNIVNVHGTGEWQGLPFMEMEYVDGVTLQVFLQFFQSLPPLLCTAITVQIARGLAYAHTQQVLLYGKKYKGIIHRDLKPSNILIGFDGIVKIMDFGVARPVETGLHTVNVESILGTLQYFPPEQVNGYPIDRLADIYSFGAVLYEMLCGVNPFPQLNLAELIRAKTDNKYTRLHQFKMTIEPHLASLAQVCLRTEKQNRIQSSTILRDYLEDLHYSWGEESPESVIRSFFNSTEKSCRK